MSSLFSDACQGLLPAEKQRERPGQQYRSLRPEKAALKKRNRMILKVSLASLLQLQKPADRSFNIARLKHWVQFFQ